MAQSYTASEAGQDSQSRWRQNLEELRQLMLGFDVDPAQTARLFAQWSQFRETAADSDEIRRREDEILNIFVDICSLFRRKPSVHDLAGERSTQHRSLSVFLLAHARNARRGTAAGIYGGAAPGLWLIMACRPWIARPNWKRVCFGSTSRTNAWSSRWRLFWPCWNGAWPGVDAIEQYADDSFRSLLDRMIAITRGLFPSVSDLARELRYRCFEQALFEKARKQVYAQAEEHLAYLAANPQAADQRQRVNALIECPQPLASFFSGRFAAADPDLRQLMLEVMTSRYYRRAITHKLPHHACQWTLLALRQNTCKEESASMSSPRMLTTTDLAKRYDAMRSCLAEVPAEDDIVLDLYLWNSGSLPEPERTQQEVCSCINQARFPRPIQRIVVAVAGPDRGESMAGMQHFTYQPAASGYEEEKLFRGVHPMMGERLHLWRLKNFTVERLPSVEDVYLLHAMANDNPKDERLFAVAEVRDLTPVRDETRPHCATAAPGANVR